jgi:hypothetical protein
MHSLSTILKLPEELHFIGLKRISFPKREIGEYNLRPHFNKYDIVARQEIIDNGAIANEIDFTPLCPTAIKNLL